MDRATVAVILTLWVVTLPGPVKPLIGYDCGGEGLNITSLSLTDIADCNTEDLEPRTEEIYLQLLQLNDYSHTQGVKCEIEIDRNIFHCGMHSHISAVANGHHIYHHSVTADACRQIQNTGMIVMGNGVLIKDAKVNTTTTRSATLAGTIQTNGACTGATYSDAHGTWYNVIVQASIKITLSSFLISIQDSTGDAILPSGTRCKATQEYCFDMDGVAIYWKTLPTDSCNFNNYDVLYEGTAHKMSPKSGQQEALTIYTVSTAGATFALAKTTETELCGYKIMHTEHPKLFLLETTRGRTFKGISKISINNLDIFSYVNSKFVYMKKHVKTQLNRLYKDVMKQKCALEKQVLENALSLASIAPDEMAFRLMKTQGYTAITAGEVIYLIQCTAVPCKVRRVEECYNELPVTYKNASYFIAPRSRILVKTGTQRECNPLLPTMFRIQETWFRMAPRPIESLPPPTIQPLTKPTWKYMSPSNLATSGIYSTEDLDRLRNHIMFPVEKPSMLNTLAQGAMGEAIPAGSISLYNLLDEKSLEKIAESAGSRMWKGFVTFGSESAGILSIMMIIHLAKLILNSIIRGYALHSIYGWSLHILGALWSTVANLLLYRGHTQKQNMARKGQEDEASAPLEVTVHTEPKIGENSESARNEPTYTPPQGVRSYGELNKYLDQTRSGLDTRC